MGDSSKFRSLNHSLKLIVIYLRKKSFCENSENNTQLNPYKMQNAAMDQGTSPLWMHFVMHLESK